MDIFYLAAFVAPVVALIERNHRRQHLPRAPWGAFADRDLERVRHDLLADDHVEASGPHHPRITSAVERLRRRPSRRAQEATPAVCRAASS